MCNLIKTHLLVYIIDTTKSPDIILCINYYIDLLSLTDKLVYTSSSSRKKQHHGDTFCRTYIKGCLYDPVIEFVLCLLLREQFNVSTTI